MAGKLRAQRAKAMKFRDGYMIKSGRVREGKYFIVRQVFSGVATGTCFEV